jgi:hypothetical protein
MVTLVQTTILKPFFASLQKNLQFSLIRTQLNVTTNFRNYSIDIV